jgi:hypothetical protein
MTQHCGVRLIVARLAVLSFAQSVSRPSLFTTESLEGREREMGGEVFLVTKATHVPSFRRGKDGS